MRGCEINKGLITHLKKKIGKVVCMLVSCKDFNNRSVLASVYNAFAMPHILTRIHFRMFSLLPIENDPVYTLLTREVFLMIMTPIDQKLLFSHTIWANQFVISNTRVLLFAFCVRIRQMCLFFFSSLFLLFCAFSCTLFSNLCFIFGV